MVRRNLTLGESCEERPHLATDSPSLRGAVTDVDAVGDLADGLHVLLSQRLTARADDTQFPLAALALLA